MPEVNMSESLVVHKSTVDEVGPACIAERNDAFAISSCSAHSAQ